MISSVSGLVQCGHIPIKTEEINANIRLFCGDITQVPLSWEIDFLILSAFQGDYTPTPTSVIGALKKNLNISVYQLSKGKEENLTKNFYCWYSKAIPNSPFKRILCFETPIMRQNPAEDISHIFRGLNTISEFKDNQQCRVVSSLLKTGDSGFNKCRMLKGMVRACARWILAGLNITDFVIVLYGGEDVLENERLMKKRFAPHLTAFQELRAEVNEMIEDSNSDEDFKYNCYLAFDKANEKEVKLFKGVLQSLDSSLVIKENEVYDNDLDFQTNIYEALKSSRAIVPFLSSKFLKSMACVDTFNLGYCLASSRKSDILTPVYIEKTDLPHYIQTIQWIDCTSDSQSKVNLAAESIYKNIVQRSKLTAIKSPVTYSSNEYDIFISYCHKNESEMLEVEKKLLQYDAGMRIFIDKQKLQTGSNWNRQLYEAIQMSKIRICLISSEYIKSAVCLEEFRLALAISHNSGNLILLEIDDIHSEDIKNLQVVKFKEAHSKYMYPLIVQTLRYSEPLLEEFRCFKQELMTCEQLAYLQRKHIFNQLQNSLNSIIGKSPNKLKFHFNKMLILNCNDDISLAKGLQDFLNKINQSLDVVISGNMENAEIIKKVEKFEVICVLVSRNFFRNNECINLLHSTISICRSTSNFLTTVLIDDDRLPVYVYLLNSEVCIEDDFWKTMNRFNAYKATDLSNHAKNCLLSFAYRLLYLDTKKYQSADKRYPMLRNITITSN